MSAANPKNLARAALLAAASLLALLALNAEPADAAFHVVNVKGGSFNSDGTTAGQAASHPYSVLTGFQLGSSGFFKPDGQVQEVRADLPPGFVANPNVTPTRCSSAQLTVRSGGQATGKIDCPASSQIGTVEILLTGFLPDTSFSQGLTPLYNMQPLPGTPATLGFVIESVPVYLVPSVRTGGDYGFTVVTHEVPQILATVGTAINVWGVPADPSHDPQRFCPGHNHDDLEAFGCSTDAGERAFVTAPSNCSAGALPTTFHFSSWQEPGSFISAGFNQDTNGNPTAVHGCADVPFEPEIGLQPTTAAADSPSGLDVDLSMPTDGLTSPEALSQAALKRVTVTLPAGMSVNPASADGLGGCSAAQIGLTEPGDDPHFTPDAAQCPDSSKIGTVELRTPLLEQPLEGSVYLGAQDDPATAGDENPFGSLLSLYLAVDDPDTGVVLKFPGLVEPDPATGRLVATFDDNPQIPFSSLQLHLKQGSRAPLITPSACGTYAIASSMTPWSAVDPDNPTPAETVTKTSTFEITSGPDGTPCPTPGQFDPTFQAGTVTPIAGAYSPLIVNASRPDGSQSLAGLSLTLPKGLTGKLAGIPACPEAALSAAAGKSGAEELAAPSCPAASKVGTVDVAAGAGTTPFHVTGTAYLAAPYKSAPLSLAVITPALAGPFDLGTVVVRAAARIDPVTTQIKVSSDPIPSILQGIPLKVRSVSVDTDRPEFTLNPTSCDPMSLEGTLFGTSASKAVSNRFQVGACKALDFAPKLALSLKGPTHRRAHPSLKAVLTAKPGEANIARAQVRLPRAAFIDNAHIGTPCTRPAFATHTCPEASRVGKVSATTPILDYTLKGSVYLRANPAHKLPDLVADLRGPDSQPIEIELAGKTDAVKGALRNSFEAVPDAPVTKFTLELFGGKKGLIELSSGLCAHPRASVKLDAQSGAVFDTSPKVKADCP